MRRTGGAQTHAGRYRRRCVPAPDLVSMIRPADGIIPPILGGGTAAVEAEGNTRAPETDRSAAAAVSCVGLHRLRGEPC